MRAVEMRDVWLAAPRSVAGAFKVWRSEARVFASRGFGTPRKMCE